MARTRGRKPGLMIYPESFEALLAFRGILKKDFAADVGVSPGFIGDLMAGRGGVSRDVADRMASSLGLKVEALFPELRGWVPPLPDREAKREPAARRTKAAA